jgi:hypothetical protein
MMIPSQIDYAEAADLVRYAELNDAERTLCEIVMSHYIARDPMDRTRLLSLRQLAMTRPMPGRYRAQTEAEALAKEEAEREQAAFTAACRDAGYLWPMKAPHRADLKGRWRRGEPLPAPGRAYLARHGQIDA